MKQYHDLLKLILSEGSVTYEPRTEEYIMRVSASLSKYDLRGGFPLVTTKRVGPRLPFEELFWKLRGERNVKPLVDRNVNIWTANAFDKYLRDNGLVDRFPKHTLEWNAEFERYSKRIKNDPEFAEDAGDLGPVYGYNWRHSVDEDGNEIDQLVNLLNSIKKSPGSRYHVLDAWNVGRLKKMAIGPCPFWHQFSIYDKDMDLTMVQRSDDVFLGAPFNIAQDALLLHLVARETGYNPRFFNHQNINLHTYLGVAPRTDFWTDEKNVEKFRKKLSEIEERADYLELKNWYLKTAPPESAGNQGKDHIPFLLEQLSREPKPLPDLEFISDLPLLEAIHKPPLEIVKINNYHPYKWNSRAIMAA